MRDLMTAPLEKYRYFIAAGALALSLTSIGLAATKGDVYLVTGKTVLVFSHIQSEGLTMKVRKARCNENCTQMGLKWKPHKKFAATTTHVEDEQARFSRNLSKAAL